jgi:hypothetical protein
LKKFILVNLFIEPGSIQLNLLALLNGPTFTSKYEINGNVAITTANYYSNYSELGNRAIKVNMVTTVALVTVVNVVNYSNFGYL